MLSVETERGRDFPSQLTGKSIAGRLVAAVNNQSGDYSPFNASGGLYGNLLPGRKVQLISEYDSGFTYTFPFAFTNTPLWTGYVESIDPDVRVGNAKIAMIRAIGPLGLVNQREVRIAGQANKRTDELISTILQDANWDSDDLDLETGQTTVTKYWTTQINALKAIREIEETEPGFIYEMHDGKIKFEDRTYRGTNEDALTSVLTFSDASDRTYSYETIKQENAIDSVFNVVEATVKIYSTGSIATLWTHPESGANSPLISAGATNVYYAEYPPPLDAILASEIAGQVSVEAWTTPVATTDYTVNAAADGSGSNLTSSVSVAVVKLSNIMKISLSNTGATDGYITLLKARGTTVVTSDPALIIAEDATSQTAYAKRTYTSRAKWIPSSVDAQNWCNAQLSVYKDPQPRITISFTAGKDANHMYAALEAGISTRVTLVAANNSGLGINEDFFIENIRHKITEGNTYHHVTLELSPVSVTAGFFTLGHALLGTSTKLFY